MEKEAGGKISSFPIMSNRDVRELLYKEDVVGPYVFVYIDKNNHFSYYILSKQQFVETSKEIEKSYDELSRIKPLKKGSPMVMPRKALEKYQDEWSNLWL